MSLSCFTEPAAPPGPASLAFKDPICDKCSVEYVGLQVMILPLPYSWAGFDNPVLAAVSDAITFKNPNEPLQGHLALTHNISEMMYVHTNTDKHYSILDVGTLLH
jgi:hypothetical protein